MNYCRVVLFLFGLISSRWCNGVWYMRCMMFEEFEVKLVCMLLGWNVMVLSFCVWNFLCRFLVNSMLVSFVLLQVLFGLKWCVLLRLFMLMCLNRWWVMFEVLIMVLLVCSSVGSSRFVSRNGVRWLICIVFLNLLMVGVWLLKMFLVLLVSMLMLVFFMVLVIFVVRVCMLLRWVKFVVNYLDLVFLVMVWVFLMEWLIRRRWCGEFVSWWVVVVLMLLEVLVRMMVFVDMVGYVFVEDGVMCCMVLVICFVIMVWVWLGFLLVMVFMIC